MFTVKVNHGMRRGRNKQLNGMKMNIKCIQKRRSNHYLLRALLIFTFSTLKPYTQKPTTPLTIIPSKTLKCKKRKKNLQSVTEYTVDLHQNKN